MRPANSIRFAGSLLEAHSLFPPKSRFMNDTHSRFHRVQAGIPRLIYQSMIARSLAERYVPSMAVQAKAKLVAIVDDDELMRSALQAMLKSVGLPSQVFASAEEFLESGQRNQTAC